IGLESSTLCNAVRCRATTRGVASAISALALGKGSPDGEQIQNAIRKLLSAKFPDGPGDRIPVDFLGHMTPRDPNCPTYHVIRKTHRLQDMAQSVILRRAR